MNLPSAAGTQKAPSTAASDRPNPFLLALALVIVLLIWSFNYVAGKIALRHIDAISLASMRLPLAALLMLPIFFMQRRRTALQRSDFWTFTYLGFFGVVVNMGCYTLGLSQTTSGHAVVVMALGPILVLLLGVALNVEKLTLAKATGMAISFFGIAVLETEQVVSRDSSPLIGDLITLMSISGFAVFAVLAKKVSARYDAISMNTYNVTAGALIATPVALWQATHLRWGSVGWAGWAGMFYMAGFSTVASYIIFNWVLRYMDPSRVAAVNYVQPIIVILISVPLLGESPTGHLLTGAALVLLGVYLAERTQ